MNKANGEVSTKNLGNKIEIRIQDNGPGIPNNIKQNLPAIFYNKADGHGTGWDYHWLTIS